MQNEKNLKSIKQKKYLNPNLIRVLFVIGFYILVHDTYNNLAFLGITLLAISIIWLIIDYLFVLDEINKYISLVPASFDVFLNMLFVYITGAGNSMVIVFAISSIAMSTILADHRGFYQSLFIIATSIILYTLMILALSYSFIPYINLLDFSKNGFHFHSILSIIFYITFALGTFYGLRNIKIAQLISEKKINRYAMSVEQAYSELQVKQSELQESKEVTEHALRKANQLNEMIQVIVQSNSVDEIFERIYQLFYEKYGLTSYLVYVLDKEDGFIKLYKTYGDDVVEKSYLSLLYKNWFRVDDENCVHSTCIVKNRSFLIKKINLPHPSKKEEENIIVGGIQSMLIIPLTIDNEAFGSISFADNKFFKSRIKDISKSIRMDIENFIKLISPSIYQSLQKQKIDRAYSELHLTKNELESKKSQMERLQSMSQEVQKKTDFREMLITLEDILWDTYKVADYLLAIYNQDKNYLEVFSICQHWEKFSFNSRLKNISLNESRSVHNLVFQKKRSLFLPKLKNVTNGEEEDFNRELLGMESVYAIPCIVNNEVFAILTFSDTRPENSRDPNIRGVRRLTSKQRDEIEQLVALIANPLYQSLQKKKIDQSYIELQTTKNELESKKSQIERLQSMSQEIQIKSSFRDMLKSLERILWDTYRIGDYSIWVYDSESNELRSFSLQDRWLELSIDEKLKNIPLNENESIHKMVFDKKRSLFLSKLKNISAGNSENFNRNFLGMESLFAIPCIVNNESFAVLSFSDLRPEFSRDPNIRGVKRLTPKQRDEIEQLVALIANPLYQSLQKQKIEAAYKELQETQTQLIEAERMASLGQLVGGIAHEINNPIAVIHSHAELLDHNNHITLREVPLFLETLTPPEKTIFYGIVDQSVKNRIFLNSKEERKQRKDTEKLLQQIVEDEDLRTTLSESLVHLRLPPPYETYINELGAERFSQFLSMAEVFKNQSNSLSSIEIAVEKASRVIFALRSYLNTELSSSRKEVDLVKELDKALHVYDNYVMGKINIRQDFPKELKYTCVAENIAQVWKNLFFNSIQAMYNTDKKLEIRLEQVEKLPESLKDYKTSSIVEESLFQKDSGKGWILVYITDSGTGIPLELQDKVFTPFFTTKSLGEGIGLGLYTSKKIIHEHGGALFFKSGEGRTEFVVVLPS